MPKKRLYQKISNTINAYLNSIAACNVEWADKRRETIQSLAKLLPSGSGFDSGTTISLMSTENKIYLDTSFHHMDENGSYDGWTDHLIIVTPTFNGIDIEVTGENRNDINDYIAEVFYDALNEEV